MSKVNMSIVFDTSLHSKVGLLFRIEKCCFVHYIDHNILTGRESTSILKKNKHKRRICH